MQYKDYYQILGVTRDAEAEEIKRSYRKLARKYHPDVSKEKNAEERFKEVAEAYEVLRDTEKRAAYDQLGRDYRSGQQFRPPPDWAKRFGQGGAAGGQGFSDLNGFSDFFSSLFGGGAGVGGAGYGSNPRPNRTPVSSTLRWRKPSRAPSAASCSTRTASNARWMC
jgi:curved DNA-binding protein